MFEVSIESVISAAHAIVIDERREELHGHDWRVRVTIASPELDPDGLVCDFHAIEAALGTILARFRNRTINAVAPFDGINPTAERLAEHVGRELAAALDGSLPPGARIARVRVTEAPGCAATWIAPSTRPGA